MTLQRAFPGLPLVLSLVPALFLLAAPAGARAEDGEPERSAARGGRPNIVFVFSDDHAPHAIGAYARREGGVLAELDPTPRIDRLAEQGMVFRNSFCTNSICGPSRAVVLTGLHSFRNGFMVNGDRFDADRTTFPALLREAGYRTALFGKWHLGSDPRGFDEWEVLPGQGDYYNPRLLSPRGERVIEGHCTDIVTDLAIDWLERNAREGEPFLLMCQHKAPHRNWMPAPRHLDLWDDVQVPEPPTLFDDHADDARPARRQEMEIDRHLSLGYDLFVPPREGERPSGSDPSGFRNLARMTDAQRAAWNAAYDDENQAFRAADLQGEDLVRWKYQRYIKNYLRCVRGVDESVGRIVDWLDEHGLGQDTLVVYSSDQGFYLGDHGWYDKRWMYEESLRMPLVVRWPGVVPAGTVNTDLVQNLDHAPTFLELAGLEVPAAMQGRSLLPLLRGEQVEDWRDAIYYHYHEFPAVHQVARHHGVRTRTHKLIHYYQLGEWELFDLVEDPDELLDLHGDPRYRDLELRLALRLGELREHYGDETDISRMSDEWLEQQGFPPR